MAEISVQSTEECMTQFHDMKLNQSSRYITYKFLSENEIGVDVCGPPSSTYDQFVAVLPENEPRFAIYNFSEAGETGPQKLVFFSWVPDGCQVRMKMVAGSYKEQFKRQFQGILKEIQASDGSDLERSEVDAAIARA